MMYEEWIFARKSEKMCCLLQKNPKIVVVNAEIKSWGNFIFYFKKSIFIFNYKIFILFLFFKYWK